MPPESSYTTFTMEQDTDKLNSFTICNPPTAQKKAIHISPNTKIEYYKGEKTGLKDPWSSQPYQSHQKAITIKSLKAIKSSKGNKAVSLNTTQKGHGSFKDIS